MKLVFPDAVSLAQLPTPIIKLEKFSKYVEGPQIYLKRDDYTGLALTGNKVRKLEFIMSEALAHESDYVITCGSSQSNHARTTAVAAAKLGLRCYLVLRNNMGAALEGNLFLASLFGAEIQYITPAEYMKVDEIMYGIANDLKEKGHKPYVIPEGGSNALGSWGYIKASLEIVNQLKMMQLKMNHIVVPVGSGGTYAGLLLGKFLYDIPYRIHGFNICDNESSFVNRISDIVKKSQRQFNLKTNITNKDIHIIDGYVGKGYGLSSQDELDLIKKMARLEGIILDPVYTAKAILGLVDQIRQGRFRAEDNILFIHTGGIFGIFPKRSLFF